MTLPAVVVCALLAAYAAWLAMPVPASAGARLARRRGTVTDRGSPGRSGVAGPVAAAAAGVGCATLVGGWLGWLAGAVAAVFVWRAMSRMEPPGQRRQREALQRSLPLLVDLMSASLVTGASPGSAVEAVARAVEGPAREELLAVSGRLRMGVDPVRVWTELGRHGELGPVGRCLARALDSGAPVADAMQRLGEDLRRRARSQVETRARAVGVKAALPLGVCMLPAFVLIGVVPLVVGSLTGVLAP